MPRGKKAVTVSHNSSGTRTPSPVSTSMVYTEAPVSTAVPVAGSVTLVPTRTATAVYVPARLRRYGQGRAWW